MDWVICENDKELLNTIDVLKSELNKKNTELEKSLRKLRSIKFEKSTTYNRKLCTATLDTRCFCDICNDICWCSYCESNNKMSYDAVHYN